jgi:hypothetical protein
MEEKRKGGSEMMEDVKGKQERSISQTILLPASSFQADGIKSDPPRKLFKNYFPFLNNILC